MLSHLSPEMTRALGLLLFVYVAGIFVGFGLIIHFTKSRVR